MSHFNPKSFLWLQALGVSFLTVFFLLSPQSAQAGIGDGLTDLEKKELWKQLKRIHARLDELETQNLKALQDSQSMILQEIQELKSVIPQLQGTLEQNRVEIENQIMSMTSELNEMRAQTQRDRNQLYEEWKKLHEEVATGMKGIREGIAQDVEKLAEKNRNFLIAIQNNNKSALETVAQRISVQTEQLGKTQAVISEELIPAIAIEGKKSLEAMGSKFETMELSIADDLSKFQKENQSVLAKIDTKFWRITEILQKSISLQKSADEEFMKQIQLVNKNLKTVEDNQTKTNDNIITTGKYVFALRQSLPGLSKEVGAIASSINANRKVTDDNLKVLDEKSGRIGEGLKVMISNFNNMGQSVNTLHSNIGKLEEQNKNNTEKLLEKNQDLVKSLSGIGTQSATLDSKLVAAGMRAQENRENIDLANQRLTKLIEILKTLVKNQEKMGQSLKAELGVAQLKEALADLRRKANVNISRNDDIKKSVKKILSQKKSVSKP